MQSKRPRDSEFPFPCVQNKSLAPFSTLGVGGEARYFCECATIAQGAAVLSYSHREKIPVLVLGKGSNSLFDDLGFNGLVLLNKIEHFEQTGSCFKVGSGYSFARLGAKTARAGFSGLEFAAGIPASTGGAIYMNAGAQQQCTAESLKSVGYLTEQGELLTYKKQEITFGYRFSSFQKKRGMIVEGEFLLEVQDGVKEKQRELLDYRLSTQPYKQKSAGCAFRNPEGGNSAGYLIEESGLKGYAIGGAEISSCHANFIVNTGGALAKDVVALISHVKEVVYNKHNVLLEEEIRYVPYEY